MDDIRFWNTLLKLTFELGATVADGALTIGDWVELEPRVITDFLDTPGGC